MKVDGGLLFLGAIFALGWWLRGRMLRRRQMAYAPPPMAWGAPSYPQSKVSIKAPMVVIIAGALIGATFFAGVGAKGASKPKSTGKNAGMLESLFGGIAKGAKQLPQIAPGKVAKVPHGLSFTSGAGCHPKGDWSRVDARVRTVLLHAAKHHNIRVSCMHTGHSTYVKGTRRVSNHTVWRAVDIDRVDGRAVRSWNLNALAVARALGRGKYGAQPSEVGSPWSFGRRPWFTDGGHKDHLHIGFGRR